MSKCIRKDKEVRFEFFELKTAKDLIEKAIADFEELKKYPGDSYKAFNFFVTVEHIADWLKVKNKRGEIPILRIVSHLANGGKHFELSTEWHKSIKATGQDRVYEEGVFEENVFFEPLVVYLEDSEAEKLKSEVKDLELEENKIGVLKLGEMALNYWVEYFKKINNQSQL